MKGVKYYLFRASLLLFFLQSMFFWLLWDRVILTIMVALCFALIFVLSGARSYVSLQWSNLLAVLIMFCIQVYLVRDQNFNGLIVALIRSTVISIVLLLNDEIKSDIFRFFTRSFSLLLAISVFSWILYLCGVPLPYFEISFNEDQYKFDNYYFFIHNHVDMLLPYSRFSGVFLEPGQLGMIAAFFLSANKFELKKKEILIIFIALIMTFSLAAYMLLFVSASVYFTLYSKKPIRNFILWGLGCYLTYSFFANYNNGDNIINILIFERLEIVDGDLAGNNRFSSRLDDYYTHFVNSYDSLMGIGTVEYMKLPLGINAGYKVFLIQFGFIGAFLTLVFYLALFLGSSTKMVWMLFFVYLLCFLQAAYALWECELFFSLQPTHSSNPIISKRHVIITTDR